MRQVTFTSTQTPSRMAQEKREEKKKESQEKKERKKMAKKNGEKKISSKTQKFKEWKEKGQNDLQKTRWTESNTFLNEWTCKWKKGRRNEARVCKKISSTKHKQKEEKKEKEKEKN